MLILALLVGCGKKSAELIGCNAITDCYGACKDQPCIDGCLARGTAGGQARFRELATCTVKNECSTDECLAQKCAAELTACAADVAAEPAAQPAHAAGGELVTQLAGKWLGRAEVFTNYSFEGDSVKRILQIGSTGMSGHTTYSDGFSEVGKASQDGDVLVLTWDRFTFSTGPTTERYRVEWVDFIDDKHTPQLTNLACTAPSGCTIVLTKLR